MKKMVSMLLALVLLMSMSTAFAATYTPGTYAAEAQGFGGAVKVSVTVDEENVTGMIVEGANETPAIGGAAIEKMNESGIEVIAGATVTTKAAQEAYDKALALAKGEAVVNDAALAFTAGTYTATAAGYNGPVTLDVTFSESAVTDIKVTAHAETAHVGDIAFEPMIADIIAANGVAVDSVSGATFSSAAVRNAVVDAAQQAACTNMDTFKANSVEVVAKEKIEDNWDVVIVGAGGAGIAAAAQAAQDGNTVLVIEQNAEMGGNTLVSGGAFQSAMPYLVWDPADPDATTGVNPIDGNTYNKVKTNRGSLDTLKTILNWSEEPFDGTVDEAHPFVAGNIHMNAVRGVHAEYLPLLKELKAEIQAYLDWAQPKLDAGVKETDLTLFSTLNLHIFQTYYGGLRPNADNTEWIYGEYDLVKQMIEGGQDIKPWLAAQGGLFEYSMQFTLVGCLWQRENAALGGIVDGEQIGGNWGIYFAVPYNTMLKANEHNQMMLRTTAKELIVENGRVTGVKAVQYDGTEVIAHANKGVILATGGYAANIDTVQKSNIYWEQKYVADNIGTTNRSSLTGSGMDMAVAVGAATVGNGWTQMMPLGWVDNGNLSFGAGENVIFINAATGKRYVDESAERDVLSLAGFHNGMDMAKATKLGLKNVEGIYVEISNPKTGIGSNVVYDGNDVAGRIYFRSVEEAAELIGCDAAVLRETIEQYDAYVMGQSNELEVEKLSVNGTIGQVEKDENGNYLPETYVLDQVCIRFMAPSTHHTMGGLKVDLNRHVLDNDGNAIEGLYAAGEVTGGIHAGNRLGGNAITEIIVSGRVAAQAINADNK